MSEPRRRGRPPKSGEPPEHPGLPSGAPLAALPPAAHTEFMSLMGRYESGGMSEAEILASLTAKRDAIYGFVTMASKEAGTAFSEAAAVLVAM